MADLLDQLFAEWQRLGGAVLVAEADAGSADPPNPEDLIARSTAACRDSARLTWVVLDWLIRHIGEVDPQQLLGRTRREGDISVLGVLADAARQRNPHPRFAELMAQCQPAEEFQPFFHRVARSAVATNLARAQAEPVFARWNYLSNELRYLADDYADTA
jgi:hypothetical protein